MLCLPQSIEELKSLVTYLRTKGKRFVVFGNLSNVLVPDEGLDCIVILTGGVRDFCLTQTQSGAIIRAGAGLSLTKLSMDMCKRGLSGLEFAYGIPGSVGGAVFMNAGAYGGEICDAVVSVTAFDKENNVREFTREECEFSYRHSAFQTNGCIILEAVLELKEKEAEKCIAEAKDYMQRRIDKQPLEYPSLGSTFVRPVGYFAGKLIEDAGLKGYSVGGAQVSEKHAGFVINKQNAASDDVKALMRDIIEKVYEQSGVTLSPEIIILDKNANRCAL